MVVVVVLGTEIGPRRVLLGQGRWGGLMLCVTRVLHAAWICPRLVRRKAWLALVRRSAGTVLCSSGGSFSELLVRMWGGRPVSVNILYQDGC